MLCINLKKANTKIKTAAKKICLLSSVFCLLFAVSSVLFATESYALFEGLTKSGSEIFVGMRDIIYAVAGFGIIAIAIGAFFGNLNWKWLSAVIIGLMVIALTAGILSYMTDGKGVGGVTFKDTMGNMITGK